MFPSAGLIRLHDLIQMSVCGRGTSGASMREASVFGKEVHTTGGSRGSSRAFFVPSLSAMQLFVPADGSAQPSGSVRALSDAAAAQVCLLQPPYVHKSCMLTTS